MRYDAEWLLITLFLTKRDRADVQWGVKYRLREMGRWVRVYFSWTWWAGSGFRDGRWEWYRLVVASLESGRSGIGCSDLRNLGTWSGGIFP